MATISENQRNSAGTLATLPGSIKRQISCSRRPIGTSVPEFDEGVVRRFRKGKEPANQINEAEKKQQHTR